MPPTLPTLMDSCMTFRCMREILRPENRAKATAVVTTPSPPI